MYNQEITKTLRNEKEKISFVEVIIFLYVFHTSLPTVGHYTPAVVYAALVAMIYFLVFAKSGWVLLNKTLTQVIPIFSVTVLSIVTLLMYNMGALPVYLYGVAQDAIFPIITVYMISYYSKPVAKRMVAIIGASYFITTVTTWIGCKQFTSASRHLATDNIPQAIYDAYCKRNIGGFEFIYTIVLFVPLLVYLIRFRKINRVLGIAIIAVIGFTVIASEYTTALLFFAVSLCLFALPKKLKGRQIFAAIAIITIVMVFFGAAVSALLEYMASNIASITISERLKYAASLLSGDRISEISGTEGRMALYMKSINNFLSSPVYGSGVSGSGHSLILDLMSRYGLIGFTAVIIMYRQIYKVFFKRFANEEFYGYLLCVFIMAILLAIINTKDNLFVLVFAVPLFGYAFGRNEERKETAGAQLR